MNSPSFEHISDDALIAELAARRPDLVVVPRSASHIMALRGTQAGPVFMEPGLDFVIDYIKLDEVGTVQGYRDRSDPADDVDERAWLVAAAVWRGCIEGFEEWKAYRRREGDTHMVRSWERPCLLDAVAIKA
jgi:hypothetical protein